MAFGLDFKISSVFESNGFEEAEASMDQLNKASEGLGLSTSELEDRVQALDMNYDQVSGRFKDANNQFMSTQEAMSELGSEQAAISAAADEMGQSMEFVEEQLARTNMVMHENTEGAKQFRDMSSGAFVEAKDASSEMQDQMQQFEFDMLSLMFAGMAVSRVMEGLVNPAMESAGVFDVIAQTLEIFFLPAALFVLDVVLKMQDFFLGLPKPIQKAISYFVLAAIAVAKFAVLAGILKMNWIPALEFLKLIGGKISVLGLKFLRAASLIKGAVLKASAAIYTALGPVGIILGAIILIVGAFALAWKKNFLGIRQKVGKFIKWIGNNLPTIVRFFMPILGVIDLVIMAINRLFGKDIDTLGSKFEGIGENIADMGDEMIASGEKMDELDKKAEKKNPFEEAAPDNGPGSSTEASGSRTASNAVYDQRTENNIKIESDPSKNERQQARKTEKALSRLEKRRNRGK